MRAKIVVYGVVSLGIGLAVTSGCSSKTAATDAGAPTDCQALRACCDKLAGSAKDRCLIAAIDDASCQNSKAQFCGLDSAACTRLTGCCPTLAADKQAACETQVKTSSGDVELCQTALKDYPSCGGAPADAGAKPDTGGGGGGKPNCDALAVCCGKLPDPVKTKCTDLVDRGDDLYCENVKSNYCSLDPAACTKLQQCCATLSGEDKSTCELQLSTYGTDVELCGTALKKYPSCAP